MLGFISKIFGSSGLASHRTGHLDAGKTFPISRSHLESLRDEVSALWNLRLEPDEFLALALSTLVEARKGALRCNAVHDVNAILDETDALSQFVFNQLGHHVPRFRFALRLEFFKQAIGVGPNFRVESFKTLQNHAGFPAHKQIQHELMRGQMEVDLERLYGITPCRDVQRITSHSIASIGKPQYAQHCLNLFNLGIPLDARTIEKTMDFFATINLPAGIVTQIQDAIKNQQPAHAVLTRLLRAKAGVHGNHNSHPSSRFLEFVTGFVFHPNNASNVQQFLNQNSPLSFQNIPSLLVDKYLDALVRNRSQHFFENAFVQQDPCIEATIENLIDYKSEPSSNHLAVFPAPRWTPLASTKENIEALIDWQEMATLVGYVKSKNMEVHTSDHQKIEQLLASSGFKGFVLERKGDMFRKIRPLVPNGSMDELKLQLDARWH